MGQRVNQNLFRLSNKSLDSLCLINKKNYFDFYYQDIEIKIFIRSVFKGVNLWCPKIKINRYQSLIKVEIDVFFSTLLMNRSKLLCTKFFINKVKKKYKKMVRIKNLRSFFNFFLYSKYFKKNKKFKYKKYTNNNFFSLRRKNYLIKINKPFYYLIDQKKKTNRFKIYSLYENLKSLKERKIINKSVIKKVFKHSSIFKKFKKTNFRKVKKTNFRKVEKTNLRKVEKTNLRKVEKTNLRKVKKTNFRKVKKTNLNNKKKVFVVSKNLLMKFSLKKTNKKKSNVSLKKTNKKVKNFNLLRSKSKRRKSLILFNFSKRLSNSIQKYVGLDKVKLSFSSLQLKYVSTIRLFYKKLLRRNLYFYKKNIYFHDSLELIYCVLITYSKINSELFAQLLVYLLENNRKQSYILKFIKRVVEAIFLEISSTNLNLLAVRGIRFLIKGRFNKRRRSKKIIYQKGCITSTQLDSSLSYYQTKAVTIYGTFGIKVWICGKIPVLK